MRIEHDLSRFKQIVRGKIRQNLRKYVTHGEMIGRKGRDLVSGECVECTTNADCAGLDRRICDTAGHRCVECLTDGHCTDVGERCSTVLGSCAVPCTSVADCPAGDPFCDAPVGFCVECQTDGDCANGGHCRNSHCAP